MIRIFYRQLGLAIGFLGILPARCGSLAKDEDIGRSSVFFPVVGLIYGLILILSSLIIVPFFPKEVCGILLCLILVVLTRGLHIDGLSDTFDALGSNKNLERKLEIMKDSTIGPFGVTAVFFVLLLKIFLIACLIGQGGLFYITILLFPVIGRWSMVIALYLGNPARSDGLGRVFFIHTKKFEIFWSTFILINILGIAVLIGYLVNPVSITVYHRLLFFVVLPIIFLSSIYWKKIFTKSFGGLTGDNLGAICELSEVLSLMAFVVIGGV